MKSLASRVGHWRIGSISRAAGVSVDTIRFYEKVGLLPRAERTPGGFRTFSAADVATLRFIRAAKKLGFNVAEVHELVRLRGHKFRHCAPVRTLLRQKVALIRGKIRELRGIERALSNALRQCEQSLTTPRKGIAPSCPTVRKLESPKGGSQS